jgi:hypothetical protein
MRGTVELREHLDACKRDIEALIKIVRVAQFVGFA